MNKCHSNTELSSHEGTRCQFNGGTGAIKSAVGRMRPVCALGIDAHQDFYVVVEQVDGTNPKPPQRFPRRWCSSWTALCRATALHWRWCECPPKKKSKSGPFIGSANSWSKRANSWKLRDAA